ncbi:MAG TPA: peptidase S8, partial [Bacteroidia bacterium]|nr:peptidase S8 [Bacteroidia bacterium]
MKRCIGVLILACLLPLGIYAQSPAATTPTRYWIQFRDKNNSPYSISTPLAYLSPRALQRRVNQGLVVNTTDLPVNPAYVDSIVAKGAHIHCRSKWLNGVVVQVSSPAQLSAILSLSFVSGSKGVGALAPPVTNSNTLRKELPTGVNNRAPVLPQPASMNYGPSFNQINMLGGVCLHDQGFQGQGMIIAVLDAGFIHADTLQVFDSLRVNHQILGGWNFVDENDSVYKKHIHGTAVLSDMGGNMTGQIIGTAPKASYWLMITEDVNSECVIEEYNWAAGAE